MATVEKTRFSDESISVENSANLFSKYVLVQCFCLYTNNFLA